MSFATPTPLPSGRPYRVVEVAGRAPQAVEDFVRADEFTIDRDGEPYLVAGAGVAAGDRVRFHEKSAGPHGKDVRVWQVSRAADGSFVAEHSAAY